MKVLTSSLVECVIFIIILSFLFQPIRIAAQTTCDPANPALLSSRQQWRQNQLVAVNVNSSQFSPDDLACIQGVFDNYNLSNQANGSGVQFSVGYSNNTLAEATVSPNGQVETSPTSYGSNFSAVYQINRPNQYKAANGRLAVKQRLKLAARIVRQQSQTYIHLFLVARH